MGCKVCPTKPNAGGPKNSGVEVLRLSFIAILVVIMVTIIWFKFIKFIINLL